MEDYWKNYNKRFGKMMQAADVLAQSQRDAKRKFLPKEDSIFDKPLTDISLYRKDGKFITPYHADLLKKRKEGSKCCPVYDISFRMYLQKQYDKEYKALVCSTSEYKPKRMKMKLMDYEEACSIFINDYLNKAFYHQEKAFVIDDSNEQVIVKLISYFTRQNWCELDVKKGICLYGDIGTGKSSLMRQFSKFTKDYDLETQFDFVYMDDVYSDCDSSGLESLDKYKFRRCVFDDIGMRGENNVNNYGTKINAYKELVRRQYNRYTRTIPSLSHYTTNIQYHSQEHTKDLLLTFGGRELDRFREMCNFVELSGKSRRN